MNDLRAHRWKVVRRTCGRGPQAERLAACAPDLKPEEGIWRHMKQVDIANVCFKAGNDLKSAARQATERSLSSDV